MQRVFTFGVLLLLSTIAAADVSCQGTLTGTVNDNIIVDGGKCTITDANINGGITVKNLGELYTTNVVVNGDVSLQNALRVSLTKSTLNRNLLAAGGRGGFSFCGSTVNGDVVMNDRGGDMHFGGTKASCASTLNGKLTVYRGLHSSGGHITVRYTTVSHATEIKERKIVTIFESKFFQPVLVQGSLGAVTVTNSVMTQTASFLNNKNGLTITGSTIDTLKCFNNTPPISVSGNTVIRREGQCV